MKETAIQVSKSFNDSDGLNKDISIKVLTLNGVENVIDN